MAQLKSADVLPGDILLHSGKGEISKLIKWVSDSEYSHAAFVYESGLLAEATSRGVNLQQSLDERIKDTENFSKIDVIRPKAAPTEPQLDRLRASAKVLKGQKFALNQMFELGLICAVKNKVAPDLEFKILLTWLLTRLIPDDPDRLVCSEFVYLSFHKAAVEALDPLLVVTAPKNTPFPQVDFLKLWEEYEEARKRAAPGASPPALAHEILALQLNEKKLDSMIHEACKQLPQSHTAQLEFLSNLNAPPHVNPFLVLPQDLRDSPTFEFLGQLMP